MAETQYVPRLRTHYANVVRPRLTEQFGYKNPMEVPSIDKVVLNMGIGEGVADRKKVESAAAQLEGSKGFTKDLCRESGIPTAAYGLF